MLGGPLKLPKRFGGAVVTAAQRLHEALHTVRVTLHDYVREPVVNFDKTVSDRLRGR